MDGHLARECAVGDFFWHEEVKDWRPKLQQAVKRALEKFYGGATGQN
jgi:hypothetical protein